jgi:DNA-directed RNA polymerase subunit RPC12/RpoP
MKYNLTCKECKEKVLVSTRDESFIMFRDKDGFMKYSVDCPKCNEEIVMTPVNQRTSG